MHRLASLVIVAACSGGSSTAPAVAPARVANVVAPSPDAAPPEPAPPDAAAPDAAIRPGFTADGLVHSDQLGARDRFHYEEQMRHHAYSAAAKAFMESRFTECATMFAAIYEDTKDVAMLYNVALCHHLNGEHETALAEYQALVHDTQLPADLRKAARKAIRTLKAALRRSTSR